MPLDSAQWMIQLKAADQTAAAFNSLNQRMKQSQIVADGVQKGMSSAFGGVTRMLGPLAAAFSAAAVAQKVWAAGMKAADMGEQAEQIGLTTDLLQAYRMEAAQNGVTVEQLDGAMMKLTRSMGEANGGSDDAIARFEKLGVKLLDANGELRKSSEVLPEVARGLLKMGSDTERNALMMEIFGRSGSRMVTILQALAEGNDDLVRKAREANAVMDNETIKAWDRVGNQMEIAKQRAETLFAQLGAPIATTGLSVFNAYLRDTEDLLNSIGKAGKWLFGGAATGGDLAGMQKEAAEIQKRIDANSGATGTAAQAALQRDYARLGVLQRKIEDEMTAAYMPPVVVTADKPGVAQPTGNKQRATGEKDAAAAIRESQKQMDDLFALMEKQRKAADAIEDRYGDGVATLARETAELAEIQHLLAPETVQRAMEDLTRKADDQARAVRGAAGGIDGYAAGIEQAFADMERTNAAFEAGKETVDLLSNALTELATTGEINFQKLLNSFLKMIIEMEMRAAASAVFKAIGGGSGIAGLIGGLLGGGSLSGGAVGGGTGGGYGTYALGGAFHHGNVIPFASGGIVNRPTLFPFANGTGLMGEAGPEAIMPLSRGADGKLGVRMNGGGGDAVTVIVNQTVHVGEFVTTTQYAAGLRSVEQSAREGAMAGIEAKRKRGGAIKQVFR